ncbi:MAG: hypothetical protein V2A67_01170 [Bacteroidota bacterium]
MKKAILILIAARLMACDPFDIDPGEIIITPDDPVGTLVVDFPVTHQWLPTDRIIRTDLHIAVNVYELYKGNYIQSANLTNSQQKYSFCLAPGNYYLVAGIACLCEGDSCSAGGFPGNKWGQKFASYNFTIEEDQTTDVIIRFLQ